MTAEESFEKWMKKHAFFHESCDKSYIERETRFLKAAYLAGRADATKRAIETIGDNQDTCFCKEESGS
jgi:predicted methyltransferase